MVKFRCGQCGQKIGVPEAYAGKRVRCPRCQQPARVPHEAEADPQPLAVPAEPEPIVAKAQGDFSSVFGDRAPTSADADEGSSETSDLPGPITEVIDAPARQPEPPPDSAQEIAALLRGLDPGEAAEGEAADEGPEPATPAAVAPHDIAEALSEESPQPPTAPHPLAIALGAVSVLAGGGAVGLFWTPAVARFALLVAAVGIGLALLGIIVAAMRRGRGMGLPVAGAFVSCAAVAFIVLAMRGLLPDRFVPPGQHTGSSGAIAMAETDSPDSPGNDPSGASSPIAPARAGDVEVRLASALVLQPSVYDGDWNTVHTATARYLQITLELRNLGEAGEAAYQTWGKPASEGPFASVTDARGNPLKLMDLSPMMPVGRAKEPKTLYAHGPAVPDVLLFEPPVANNADLTLELPGANVGMPGKTLSLRIPAEVIKRQ